MGNTSSSSSAASPGPVGRDDDAEGSSGSIFRLPLYRGERDAFLPIEADRDDDHQYDHDQDDEERWSRCRSPPPALSLDPRTDGGGGFGWTTADRLGDGVSKPRCDDDAVDAGVGGAGQEKRPHNPEGSPPSVVSSSDSSYGTCSSSLVGGSSRRSRQHSYHPGPERGRRRVLVPAPLPGPAPRRGVDWPAGGGAFDCVRPPLAAAPRLTRNDGGNGRHSASSLTSLFEMCVRPGGDDDNEYDDGCGSDHGSYYSAAADRHHRASSSLSSQCSSHASLHHRHQHRLTSNPLSKASLASAVSSSALSSASTHYTAEERAMLNGDEPTLESDLRRVRDYHVVTTAALPWMTGTAVNPLLRAAHLLRRNMALRKEEEDGDGRGEHGWEEGEVEAISDGGEQNVPRQTLNLRVPNLQKREARKEIDETMDAQIITREGDPGEKPKIISGRRQSPETEEFESSVRFEDSAPPRGEDGLPRTPPGHDEEAPLSPCSLDYSCFSFSEFETPGGGGALVPADPAREVVSPLGDEDDSLLISPFTPCEGAAAAMREDADQRGEPRGRVTLILPWLRDAADRLALYGSAPSRADVGGPTKEDAEGAKPMFAREEEQEAFLRSWLAREAGMPEEAEGLDILFYPARYHKSVSQIFALGDICDLIADEAADVCILEEPEHLNWYGPPGCAPWSGKFRHCVGVAHTNYKAYARDHAPAGFLAAPLLAGVNGLVVGANCHLVVKLSGVIEDFTAPAGDSRVFVTENVHGIRQVFLDEGRRRRASVSTTASGLEGRRAYFVGKLLWAKGFDQLLDLQASYRERMGENFEIDIYGTGPDEHEIKRAFHSIPSDDSSGILTSLSNKWSGGGCCRHYLPVNFVGEADHASLAGDAYSVFVNPSLTEVLCTTTAEAIAMGRWALIPSHPSNAFFAQFPNCLLYRNRREFVSRMRHALDNDPPHLPCELAHLLTWEEAMERCVRAAAIPKRVAARIERLSQMKEEKTLKKTLSSLWSGSKVDIQTMDAGCASSPT